MKKGDVIKWTEGSKEVLGQVLTIDDKRVKFKTSEGTMDVLLTDGKFEIADKDTVIEAKPPPQRKSKRVRPPPMKGTKTEHAQRVFKQMKGSSRQDIIKAFIKDVGLTPAGANTYYTNCKKASE